MVINTPNSTQQVLARVSQSAQTTVEKGLHKLEFRAMSTLCRVHCHGVSAEVARDFQRDVVLWTAQFEARYSRFIPDSLIGRINAAAGEHWVEIDPDMERIFTLCQELFFFTRRAFDPTSLPLIKLWDWKNQPHVIPSDDHIRTALELVGWNKVQRRAGGIFLPAAGMSLDLGGIGKEYAVDCVMNMAIQRGIPNVMVDFGRDVRVRGHASRTCCLQPRRASRLISVRMTARWLRKWRSSWPSRRRPVSTFPPMARCRRSPMRPTSRIG